MNSLVVLAIGFLLIFLEFFAPGAIFGIMGIITVGFSLILFAMENHSALELIFYFAAVFILLFYFIKFILWRILKTKKEQTLYSDADQEGYVASTFNKDAIGKKGIVLTDLKPGGYILIGDNKYQALSLSGYLSKGTEVEVIDGQEESLLVKPIKQDKSYDSR